MGKKIGKCSSLNETNAGDQNISLCQNMVATLSQGQVILIDLESAKKLGSIPMDKTTPSSARTSFDLVKQDDDHMILIEGEMVHQLIISTGKVKKSWKCPMDGSLEKQYHVGHGNSITALLFKNGQYQVVSKILSPTDDEINFGWASLENSVTGDSTNKEKQKRKHSGAEPRVLGPGQTGGEALISDGPVSKKSKTEMDLDQDDDNDDGENPTIAERLQLLQQALDDDVEDDPHEAEEDKMSLETDGEAQGFIPKNATTESLGKVLQQGLQSGESKLLELALSVTDRRIVKETCAELPDVLIPNLVTALTARMAAKGSRAVHLIKWLSVLLEGGRVRSLEHLQPLRNLIYERVECFSELLQTEGRLSLVSTRVEEEEDDDDDY